MNFFQKLKEKDKFFKKPEKLPETAKDTYGSVSDNKKVIIQNVEHKKEVPPDDLPGTGEAIPKEFKDKDINVVDEKITKSSKSKENYDSVNEPRAIKQEEKKEKEEKKPKPEIKYSSTEGFFGDFEKFLKNKDLDKSSISELLDRDLLHKMKQFHVQREEGVPFFFHKEDSDRELAMKMEELQRLEEEWYVRHKMLKEAEISLMEKEAEIDIRLEEFKNILAHIKNRDLFEKKAPTNSYFQLGDGVVLRSIGELREALKKMNDSVFEHHVTNEKNDFVIWINHVFDQQELADRISLCSSRKELLKVLLEY